MFYIVAVIVWNEKYQTNAEKNIISNEQSNSWWTTKGWIGLDT